MRHYITSLQTLDLGFIPRLALVLMVHVCPADEKSKICKLSDNHFINLAICCFCFCFTQATKLCVCFPFSPSLPSSTSWSSIHSSISVLDHWLSWDFSFFRLPVLNQHVCTMIIVPEEIQPFFFSPFSLSVLSGPPPVCLSVYSICVSANLFCVVWSVLSPGLHGEKKVLWLMFYLSGNI